MILLGIGVITGLILIGFGAFLRREDRADDRRAARRDPFPRQPEHPGFGDIKRSLEVAHDAPWPPARPPAVTVHDLTHHQLPIAPDSGRAARAAHASAAHGTPARAIPFPAGRTAPPPSQAGAGPGTAAAAGENPPPVSPPPLPDAAYATTNPDHPYRWWDPTQAGSEEFVEAMAAKRMLDSWHAHLEAGAS